MIELLFTLPWVVSALIVIVLAIAISLFAMWLVHRTIPPSSLRDHHDVAGVTIGVVGVIYAVLLGFIVSSAQGISTRAAVAAEQEAELLIVLSRNAAMLDPALGAEVRHLSSSYALVVMEHDWAELAHRRMPRESRHSLTRLYHAIHAFTPHDARSSAWYAECASILNRIADARTERIGAALTGLGPMLWSLLVAGGIMTVSGLFFFGPSNRMLHRIMASMLSGVVTFMLLVVLDLEHPFAGGLAVDVEPFQRVLEILSTTQH